MHPLRQQKPNIPVTNSKPSSKLSVAAAAAAATTTTRTVTNSPSITPISNPNESAISVCVRIRPINQYEKERNATEVWKVLGDTCIVSHQSHQQQPQQANPEERPRDDSSWVFDRAFGPETSTQNLYEDIAEPVVSSSLAGINGTIFAYGQTASGKTHTMQGTETDPGILRLSARQLFEDARNTPQVNYTFVCNYVELYNETIKDLLSTAHSGSLAMQQANDLKIREDRNSGFYVEGVTEIQIQNYEELLALFVRGESRRHVAGTDMNEKSSRSHTIFTINVTAKEKPNESGDFAFGILRGRLSLVDLAGSENVRSTNAEGERLKEGGKINTSLLTLSRVISSLALKKPGGAAPLHINFRDSKLTQILQPSLAGNCRTAIVCCITPASSFVAETMSTLKFASSAKKIRTQVVVNQIADVTRNIRSYQDQVDHLQKTLVQERDMFTKLQDEVENLKEKGGGNLEELIEANKMLAEKELELEVFRKTIQTVKEESKREIEVLKNEFQAKEKGIESKRQAEINALQSMASAELDARQLAISTLETQKDGILRKLADNEHQLELLHENELRAKETIDLIAMQLLQSKENIEALQHSKEQELLEMRRSNDSHISSITSKFQVELTQLQAQFDSNSNQLSVELENVKTTCHQVTKTRDQLETALLLTEGKLNDLAKQQTQLTFDLDTKTLQISEMEVSHSQELKNLEKMYKREFSELETKIIQRDDVAQGLETKFQQLLLEKQASALELENNHLVVVKQHREEISKLETELQNQHAKEVEMKSKLDSLSLQLDLLQVSTVKQIQQLQEEKLTLENQHAEQLNQIQGKQQELFQTELEQHRIELQSLQTSISEIQHIKNETETQLNLLQTQLNLARNQRDEAQNEIGWIQTTLEDCHEKNSQLSRRLQSLQEELEQSIIQRGNDVNKHEEEIKDKEQICIENKQQIKLLTTKLENLTLDLSSANEQLQDKTNKLNETESAVRVLKTDNDTLNRAKTQAEACIEESNLEMEKLRDRVQKLEKVKLTEKEAKRIKELREKYDDMKLQLAQSGPPSADSLYELNKRLKQAELARDEAIKSVNKVQQMAEERSVQLEQQHKESVKFLEKENLDLMWELRKLGGGKMG